MNKNYLTQVVWLVILTIALLVILSLIPPIEINFTTRQIDIFSDLRTKNIKNNDTEEVIQPSDTIVTNETDSNSSDTIEPDTTIIPQIDIANVKRKAGDITLIEDYSTEQNGLDNLLAAIENRNSIHRPVRIAFLGDSFIEADILTQNIRLLLQDMLGGCGVGYMAMHSDFPGFRRSITQSDKGWETTHIATPDLELDPITLTLQYHTANGEAYTRLKGVNKLNHLDRWEVSTIGFIAQDSAAIEIKTDSTSHIYNVAGSAIAQFIAINEPTSTIEVRCSDSDVLFWGTWLDGNSGIAVDNISIRGYSGTTLHTLPIDRMQQLDRNIPYDLIVLQYGLNRMTIGITDYTAYTRQLTRAIAHLRQAFPHTDILIMGIGDRCQNIDNEITTLPEVYAMRKAQRNAAIESQCLFWDSCEAMHQLGGMGTFVTNKWANKDYTHINHTGGAPLANEFVKAIQYAIDNYQKPQSTIHPQDSSL